MSPAHAITAPTIKSEFEEPIDRLSPAHTITVPTRSSSRSHRPTLLLFRPLRGVCLSPTYTVMLPFRFAISMGRRNLLSTVADHLFHRGGYNPLFTGLAPLGGYPFPSSAASNQIRHL